MAKKSTIRKNLNRKQAAISARNKRNKLAEIAKNIELPFEERLKAQIKLAEMSRNSSYIRYRNRCSLSGRPRGFYRKFSLSRIALRDLASWGQIPGLIKSSW
jgi:small subunit ribosomal protein S14